MNAEQLAAALGAVRSGRQYKCRCVAHEDSNPSMIIFDGREAVQVRCMAGCEPKDIIAVLRSRGLWDGSEVQEEQAPPRPSESDKREHRLRLLARFIFDQSIPIRGTEAERYFERRDLLSVARMVEDIRFHSRCARGSGADYCEQPAVVIAMRSIHTNAITAIQRIFLTRAAKKDGAMMLGSAGRAAMKLQHLQDGSLHVCEGLETGLAIIAMDHGPVWALGSAGAIQSFPVLDSVSDLTIWADNDAAGLKAADVCKGRWEDAAKKATIYHARQPGWDQADVWSARCARL